MQGCEVSRRWRPLTPLHGSIRRAPATTQKVDDPLRNSNGAKLIAVTFRARLVHQCHSQRQLHGSPLPLGLRQSWWGWCPKDIG
jgi:hypothetical protein